MAFMAGDSSSKRIGFQGIAGAYSENAVTELFSKNGSGSVTTVPFDNFEDLFTAIEKKTIDYALVPVENSSSGTFHNVYELLMKRNVHIANEFVYNERPCLLAHPGATIDTITEIRSHPHVLEQCKGYLNSMRNKDIVIAQHLDTAGSALMIKQKNLKNSAAIASEKAAQLYSLEILARNISDDPNLVTRYFLLSSNAVTPQRHENPKTTFAFTLKNSPGQLFKVISAFALREINISKIESKSSGRELKTGYPWELVFYVTADAGMDEDSMKKAIAQVEEFTTFVKVLGSYPRHKGDTGASGYVYGIGM
ncbi:Prephenate dehydratase-domain-containing protein [Paraphysoderma sedebokerense]|nr:Prephenate dehydratase-domain-containing protein [Paraphysoderma sedebokerense]